MNSTQLRCQIALGALTFAVAFAAPARAQTCPADCDGDAQVVINELVTGVNIALGASNVGFCSVLDANLSGAVEVNELIGGVRSSLEGCPVVSCEGIANCTEITPGDNDQETILTALIEAEPGDTIILLPGRYRMTGQISLDVDGVTIRGNGRRSTVLSFANQTTGGEGFLVTADDFTIEDIGIEDAPGDQLKLIGGRNVFMRGVRTEWTNGPDPDNGAYGLYPVQCENVLIENCEVIGASDAGIYVGQSMNIIVRRNTVRFNVAGIEIENSTDADVYNNIATQNTGGILVFNLPGLPIKDGKRTRVFHNEMFENNTDNFAPPGNTVGAVPAGTGFMVMANDQVEAYENNFRDNRTSHVILVSFNTAELLGGFTNNDELYDPFSETVYLHDNTFSGGGDNADLPDELKPLLGTPNPQVLYDGDVDPEKLVEGTLPENLRICSEDEGFTFINLDLAHGFAGLSRDPETIRCAQDRLPPVVIPGVPNPPTVGS